MKFLHLADLHIGKNVNGFSMLDEQRHAFEQIIGYVKTERPAAVAIAGDVYDRAVPDARAVGVFDDFLTALAREEVAVLLIAGNHDSPERLGFAGRLLADQRLFLCGAFDGGIRRVTLGDEHGDVHFWMLPFVRPSSVRGYCTDRSIDSYTDAVAAALDAAGVDYAARNVLLSHQFYTSAGTVPLRSESEINPVGGLDAVDAALIERFDYAALGHLHGAQSVGAGHLRYAGSPVKYSFSEWRQQKSASLVELGGKGTLSVTALPLSPLHDMREIKDKLEVLVSGDFASRTDRQDYLRVVLTDEAELVDPMGKLRSVYPNVMSLDFENARTRIDLASVAADGGAATLTPYELFGEFFLDVQGSTMSAEQADIVRELLEGGDQA